MKIEIGDKVTGTVVKDINASDKHRYIVVKILGCYDTTIRVLESTE